MRTKFDLTDRETAILELLTIGITTNAAIGEMLTLSHRTVKNYISRMIQRTGVKNRTELAVRYWAKKQREKQGA